MDGWLVLAIPVAVIALGLVADRLGWVDLSNKNRRGGSGGVMGIGDEVFNPQRHEAQIELDRQTVLPAPAPLPGDPDFDREGGPTAVYRGQVRIDLPGPDSAPRHDRRDRRDQRDSKSA